MAVELVVLAGRTKGLSATRAAEPVPAITSDETQVLRDLLHDRECGPDVGLRLAAESFDQGPAA